MKSKLKAIDEAKKEFLKENNRERKEAKINLKKAKKERKVCGEEEKKTDKKVLLGAKRALSSRNHVEAADEEEINPENSNTNYNKKPNIKNKNVTKHKKYNNDASESGKTSRGDNQNNEDSGWDSDSESAKPPKFGSKNGSAWRNQEKTDKKIKAKAHANSKGSGGSMASAGSQGTKSQASDSKGTSTLSDFELDEKKAFKSGGVTRKNSKSDAWGSQGNDKQKICSQVRAKSDGEGGSGTLTGRDGAQAFGEGSKGSETKADWKGNEKRNTRSVGASRG